MLIQFCYGTNLQYGDIHIICVSVHPTAIFVTEVLFNSSILYPT